MALMALAVGLIGYSLYNSESELSSVVSKDKRRFGTSTDFPLRQCETRERIEDRDVGNIQLNMNINPFFTVVDDPDTRIVRAADPKDAYDVLGNALDYQSIVRSANRKLGIDTHFSQNNRKTITVGAYNQKPITMLIPAPGIFPGYENQFFTKMDRNSSCSLVDQKVGNYKDIWGSVTPYHLPRDNMTALYTLGNPWGPMGVFNRAFVENANRLTSKADFVDDSMGGLPMVGGTQYPNNNGPIVANGLY
jgi:hypothetical protein